MDWKSICSLVLEHLPQPAIVLDQRGVIQLANLEAENLLGWPRHEIEGRNMIEQVVPEPHRAAARWCFDRAMRGATRRCEGVVRTRAGTALRVGWQLSLVGIGTDISLVAVTDPADIVEDGPGVPPGGLEQYEISSHQDSFGVIRQAHTTVAGIAPSEVTGHYCYAVRYGLDQPCRDCPVMEVLGGTREVTRVIRHGDRFDLTVAEAVTDEVVRLKVCRLDPDDVSKLLRARVSHLADGAELSVREREVLDYLVMGRSVDEVATILGIAPRTVKFHQSNLLDKLGADSRLDLMRLLM